MPIRLCAGLRRSPLNLTLVIVKELSNPEMAFTFLTGLFLGGALRWGYVRFLKATIRFYEYYIRERLDTQPERLGKAHYQGSSRLGRA